MRPVGKIFSEHFFVNKGRANKVLLVGLEELNGLTCFSNFKEPNTKLAVEEFRTTQRKLWNAWQKSDLAFEAVNLNSNGVERLALFAKSASWAEDNSEFIAFFRPSVLTDIRKALRVYGDASIKVSKIPVPNLQAVGFEDTEQQGEDYLGKASVGLLPVPNGFADVEINRL